MTKRSMTAICAGLVLAVGAGAMVRADEDKNEVKVKFSECPSAVQKTIQDEAMGAAVDTVDKEQQGGKIVYEADAVVTSKNYEITVTEDGTLLAKKLDNEADEGNEVKVNFADLPAAVQKTLQEQSGGAKIESADKETKDGATLFEADAKIDGKPYEIQVGEDGKLISKKIEKEDHGDEKDEKK